MFKTCTRCKTVWSTPQEYIQNTYFVCDVSEMGLAMRNCKCGTTLGIECELQYPERKAEYTQLWNTDPKYWLVKKLRKLAADR